MKGYKCWDSSLISQVINREAVEVERAIFMATHAPMQQIQYERSPYKVTDTTEEGLLREIISRSNTDQHSFIVLKGIPGTGKSHLIRWLKERFEAHNEETNGQEVILLIRRANSSLSNTLLQIIESGLFDNSQFQDQIKRLKTATISLSEQAVGNRILNGLQEAARAVKENEFSVKTDSVSSRIILDAPNFLLDPTVREALQKKGKAIERIAFFLSGDGRTTSEGEEMPGFEAEDFDFDANTFNQLLSAQYSEVTRMSKALRAKEDFAKQLASYLNSLINYAIGRLTTITVDELKRMFWQLRRQLRQEKKSLSLFIEDITAFTGLDVGLIDVLATQHGNDNPELCRLTSLIGITDSYYDDRFPDNLRERVTFLLSLNADKRDQALMLTHPDTVNDLAARYLNALRVQPEVIKEWNQNGAHPDNLPNACEICQHRQVCHQAFGSVSINSSNEHKVGLYPFNTTALWTMLQNIDANKTTRTPRSLLNSVIAYVMQSHGGKIEKGEFPPPAAEVGADFNPPVLLKPAQRRIISQHISSPAQEKRFESLILFWGNQTIDTEMSENRIISVGGLSPEVFTAFSLPVITGEEVKVSPQAPVISTPALTSTKDIPETKAPEPQVPIEVNPYAADIERWLSGDVLENYDILARSLVLFVKSYIDWEFHSISQTQVEDRIKQARFFIEGQAGRSLSQPRYTIPRTQESGLLLHALADMMKESENTTAKIGQRVSTLSLWLHQHETEIVNYVRQPDENITVEPLPLAHLLAFNGLILTGLMGKLVFSETSPRELFLRVIRTMSNKSFNRSYERYESIREKANGQRSQAWYNLIKSLSPNFEDIQREFLISINCPQGESKDVKFIDSAQVLEAFNAFVKDWHLPDYELPASGNRKTIWETEAKVYTEIRTRLQDCVQAEFDEIKRLYENLLTQIGDNTPEGIFKEILSFQDFTDRQVRFSFPLPSPDLTGRKLTIRINDLAKHQNLEGFEAHFLWLSACLDLKIDSRKYEIYLEKLSTSLDQSSASLDDSLQTQAASDVSEKVNETLEIYDETISLLDALLSSGEDQQ